MEDNRAFIGAINELYAIGRLKKEEKFNKMSLAKFSRKNKKGEVKQ
jgi:hypothetical protein